MNTSAGVTRRFSTGADVAGAAGEPDRRRSEQRPADGQLGHPRADPVQPFLRGGGFAVTLEALTLAERNLLYAIRSYARFRSLFYVAIAAQGDYTNNPYGLQGLSANLGRGIGANLTANPIGYLPTILRSAILANERNNVASFEQYLRLFQNLEEGGAVTKLQVGRIEQQLLQGRTTVLLRTQEYVDNIDNFKLQLGLPATVPLELDETPLQPIRDQLQTDRAGVRAVPRLGSGGRQVRPERSSRQVPRAVAAASHRIAARQRHPTGERLPGTSRRAEVSLNRRTDDE